jgi:hypothetical protein
MADIFNKEEVQVRTPITADRCTIIWDGKDVTQAVNFQLTYNQPITRRRTIGNREAVIYGGQPQGSITIARLMTVDGQALFDTPSWKCSGGSIQFTTGSCHADGATVTYHAHGTIVSSYSLSANPESLDVIDNISVDFLELTRQGATQL